MTWFYFVFVQSVFVFVGQTLAMAARRHPEGAEGQERGAGGGGGGAVGGAVVGAVQVRESS
jgi:hypothetical protein